jgi:hypothetical protein
MPKPIPSEGIPKAFIIDADIRKQEEEEEQRRKDKQRPRLEIPIYDPRKPQLPEEDEKGKRGVVKIDYFNKSE